MRLWLGPLAAIAACVALVMGGFLWGRQGRYGRMEATSGRTEPKGAMLSQSDFTRQVRAFGEVNQVFEGRTRWLMLTSGGADVGLDDSPTTAPATVPAGHASERMLLLRLNVVRGDDVVSTADLIIVPGKTAELRVPTKDGEVVRYRVATSNVDPSKLALRAELRAGSEAEAQAAMATDLRLRTDGGGTSAGELIAPSGRYDVRVLCSAGAI